MTQDNPKADTRCVVCNAYCDQSGLCDKHKYDEQRGGQTETDELPEPTLQEVIAAGVFPTPEEYEKMIWMLNWCKDKYRRYSHRQTEQVLERLLSESNTHTTVLQHREGKIEAVLTSAIEAELERLKGDTNE
jgi:hypothetical protein